MSLLHEGHIQGKESPRIPQQNKEAGAGEPPTPWHGRTRPNRAAVLYDNFPWGTADTPDPLEREEPAMSMDRPWTR